MLQARLLLLLLLMLLEERGVDRAAARTRAELLAHEPAARTPEGRVARELLLVLLALLLLHEEELPLLRGHSAELLDLRLRQRGAARSRVDSTC
ncbi:hypothetical protein BC834DRAFT_866252 [Gloeopeniophorella convolvens]|nr:hypothetical protein BC834DRAFT_866252 [Gloeopeniophorella convolvens]